MPIVSAGINIPAQHVTRRGLTIDTAPALPTLLGIISPSGATGFHLEEVFVNQNQVE